MITLPGLDPITITALGLFALSALLVGYSKTALGGLAVVAVAIFATLLPTKQSTAAVLMLLMVGDLIACWHYRRDADWSLIRRLLPAVLPGVLLGTVFLGFVSDAVLRPVIGVLLLVLLSLQLWVKSRAGQQAVAQAQAEAHQTASESRRRARVKAALAGAGAGFTTMTANAAGAVMTLYLSASGVDKRTFVGTNAWFFLIVNACKVPFSIGLGLLHVTDVARAAWLAPVIVVGGLLGYATVQRISQRAFDLGVLLASLLSAVALLIPKG